MKRRYQRIAARLAGVLLTATTWDAPGLLETLTTALGRTPRWGRTVVKQVLAKVREAPYTKPRVLAEVIARAPAFGKVHADSRLFRIARIPLASARMGAGPWDVPSLPTSGDLASLLGADPFEVDAYADRKNTLRRAAIDGHIHHYARRWIPKRSGGHRLLEAPKPRLKAIQSVILRQLLDRVPPHAAAYGFRAGRSAVDAAAPHVGKAVLVRVDLADFFPSIGGARVRGVFGAMGYPWHVAQALADLCTCHLPPACIPIAPTPAARTAAQRLVARHLPQGAPTSPAIANLVAFGLDVRLSAAADRFGAIYTRYADDLAFSGGAEFARDAERFVAFATRIIEDEGFRLNVAKVCVRGPAERQILLGQVVNQHAAVPRRDRERLEATLFNCVRDGPAAHNRDGHGDFAGHLAGRIRWVEQVHAPHAVRLWTLFRAVDWGRSVAAGSPRPT